MKILFFIFLFKFILQVMIGFYMKNNASYKKKDIFFQKND